jgi:hypothetical protein
MANNLTRDMQVAVISALVEGCSIRSTERMTGVNRETVGTLLLRVGNGCADLLDRTMVNLDCDRLEIDELWAFVGKKQRHVTHKDDYDRVGDTWTFVAIDADSKLVPSLYVGKRTQVSAAEFLNDLAPRLRNKVQISTDGLKAYIAPIAHAFAETGVDYAQLHKTYEAEPMGPGRYSPPKVISTEKTPVFGEPDADLVSTSYGTTRASLTPSQRSSRITLPQRRCISLTTTSCACTSPCARRLQWLLACQLRSGT